MATNKYEMARGDDKWDYPAIPVSGWSAGGKLFFVVKSALDNNSDDSAAVFKVDMDDTDITGETDILVNGVLTPCKVYECHITSDMTQNYPMDSKKQKLIAEYQFVTADGYVATWTQFTLTLYKDANRRRT